MPQEKKVRVKLIGTVPYYDPGLVRSINGSNNSEHYTGTGLGP
jgi:hypothetical protein